MSGQRFFFFFGFRDLGSFGPSCRGSRDWRGIPFFPSSSCFSGHWHAACQYVASQCELPCPAGWQREKRHTHTHMHKQNRPLPAGRSQNAAPASFFAGSDNSDHLSTCTAYLATVKPKKKKHPCSKQEDASVSASWKLVSCEEKRGV